MKRGTFKPKKAKPSPFAVLGVRHYADGREVCDKTYSGQLEYNRRKEVMWKRQHGVCGLRISPLCPVYITLKAATFEHQDGRGAGGFKRDDRIEIDGKPYNMVACLMCNSLKGSRSLSPAATQPSPTEEKNHDNA
jgi:hypothetical protein